MEQAIDTADEHSDDDERHGCLKGFHYPTRLAPHDAERCEKET